MHASIGKPMHTHTQVHGTIHANGKSAYNVTDLHFTFVFLIMRFDRTILWIEKNQESNEFRVMEKKNDHWKYADDSHSLATKHMPERHTIWLILIWPVEERDKSLLQTWSAFILLTKTWDNIDGSMSTTKKYIRIKCLLRWNTSFEQRSLLIWTFFFPEKQLVLAVRRSSPPFLWCECIASFRSVWTTVEKRVSYIT